MDHSGARMTKDRIRIYDTADFEGMQAAGRVAAEILDALVPMVAPGVSTAALDDFIRTEVERHGATSATIGYKGYRHASCISVNHVVCHGIPGGPIQKWKGETNSRDLETARDDDCLIDGDIVNIDVTVIVDGWFGDTSRMYVAGTAKPFARRLLEVTHGALMAGIAAVRPGARFGDIGHAIQTFVESQRMSVVRDFCGHGLGRVFHATPNVLHFGREGTGATMEEGMFFTIEPMVNLGRSETFVLADDWTAVTRDKSLSAQFEHSLGVTATGAEIFTLSPGGVYTQSFD